MRWAGGKRSLYFLGHRIHPTKQPVHSPSETCRSKGSPRSASRRWDPRFLQLHQSEEGRWLQSNKEKSKPQTYLINRYPEQLPVLLGDLGRHGDRVHIRDPEEAREDNAYVKIGSLPACINTIHPHVGPCVIGCCCSCHHVKARL